MLDLVAGAAPGDEIAKVPILAAQLPPQSVDDTSGARLEMPILAAMRWMIAKALESGAGKSKHPKSALQEWAAGNQRKPPEYEVIDRSGPDHAMTFTVRVHVHKVGEAEGTASSKGEAEKAAAKKFMEKYG